MMYRTSSVAFCFAISGCFSGGAPTGPLDESLLPSERGDGDDLDSFDAALRDASLEPDSEKPLPDAGEAGAPSVKSTFGAVYALLHAKCGPCHIGEVLGDLDLNSRALAHRQLVGAFASGALCDDGVRRRVVPFEPEQSLLVHKLEGTQDCGARMPTHASDRLPEHEIASIREWITGGARND